MIGVKASLDEIAVECPQAFQAPSRKVLADAFASIGSNPGKLFAGGFKESHQNRIWVSSDFPAFSRSSIFLASQALLAQEENARAREKNAPSGPIFFSPLDSSRSISRPSQRRLPRR